MRILFIGQYSEGTTAKARAETIKKILPDWEFQVIDTHIPFYRTPRFFRSFGFRFKMGPLVSRINRYILENLSDDTIDLIWTDKAVFITHQTTQKLREKAIKLIHYSPDPAFTYHQSKHFFDSLTMYDFAITTKSYELKNYSKYLAPESVLLMPQGFNDSFLSYRTDFGKKMAGLVFIGHHEKERETILDLLVRNNINVSVAGRGWESFAKKYSQNSHLNYTGTGIYGTEYPKMLSQYLFGWGALSKWVLEKHTTRTFEIPACGTALVTERNDETSSFFNDDEAIFYDSPEEMLEKVLYYLEHLEELKRLTQKGSQRVIDGGFDYETQSRGILKKIQVI